MRLIAKYNEWVDYSGRLPGAARRLRPLAWGVFLGAFLLLGLGCSKNKGVLDLDDHFSLNIAKPLPGFSDPKVKWTPAQSDVLARRGKPDFVRIWWRRDGSLVTTSDMSGKEDKIGETLAEAKQSWIYLNDNSEVVFEGASYRTQPLDGAIRLICEYGDPSDRKPPVMRDGQSHETWQWIERGLQIELVDGKEDPSKRMHFEASGTGTYLGK